MLQIRTSVFNIFQENTYIVWKEGGRCAVVDPGFYTEAEGITFFNTLDKLRLEVDAVLLTHAHTDHYSGAKAIQDKFGCKVYMNPADKIVFGVDTKMLERIGIRVPDSGFTTTDITEGDVIRTAGMTFTVINTPGHTPGGVCYLESGEEIVFTGDTLFAGTIGRTDFAYSDYDKEILSIMEKIILLDPATEVFPGHGPKTTIGRERTQNPMLEPFNEPEEEFDPNLKGISITR